MSNKRYTTKELPPILDARCVYAAAICVYAAAACVHGAAVWW